MNSLEKMQYFVQRHDEAILEWKDASLLLIHTYNPIKYKKLYKKIARLNRRISLYLLLQEKYRSEWINASI